MVDLLRPIRGRLHCFGGGHVQRDVAEQTVIAVINRSLVGFGEECSVQARRRRGQSLEHPLSTQALIMGDHV